MKCFAHTWKWLIQTRMQSIYLQILLVGFWMLNVISDWMKDETLSIVKQCDFTIIMLVESTGKSNCSEMSLIVPILQNSMTENHLLDLEQLRRCDAETIF